MGPHSHGLGLFLEHPGSEGNDPFPELGSGVLGVETVGSESCRELKGGKWRKMQLERVLSESSRIGVQVTEAWVSLAYLCGYALAGWRRPSPVRVVWLRADAIDKEGAPVCSAHACLLRADHVTCILTWTQGKSFLVAEALSSSDTERSRREGKRRRA